MKEKDQPNQPKDPSKPEATFIGPDGKARIVTPENITPKERARIAVYAERYFQDFFSTKVPVWVARLNRAAAEGDQETLRKGAHALAAYASKLSEWADACGEHASPKLREYIDALEELRGNIYRNLAGEMPGQQDEE